MIWRSWQHGAEASRCCRVADDVWSGAVVGFSWVFLRLVLVVRWHRGPLARYEYPTDRVLLRVHSMLPLKTHSVGNKSILAPLKKWISRCGEKQCAFERRAWDNFAAHDPALIDCHTRHNIGDTAAQPLYCCTNEADRDAGCVGVYLTALR
jgi:hypothetical protein